MLIYQSVIGMCAFAVKPFDKYNSHVIIVLPFNVANTHDFVINDWKWIIPLNSTTVFCDNIHKVCCVFDRFSVRKFNFDWL